MRQRVLGIGFGNFCNSIEFGAKLNSSCCLDFRGMTKRSGNVERAFCQCKKRAFGRTCTTRCEPFGRPAPGQQSFCFGPHNHFKGLWVGVSGLDWAGSKISLLILRSSNPNSTIPPGKRKGTVKIVKPIKAAHACVFLRLSLL